MVQVVRFCCGCNEKFPPSDESGVCPHCGQELTPLSSAPTVEIRDLEAREICPPETRSVEDEDDDLVGRRIACYAVESVAGRGGMARVYRARHLTLHRTCALKVLSRRLVESDPTYLELFHAEARAVADLVHPHIVTVHNIGSSESCHFIEMEFVEGTSLRDLVLREGPLPPLVGTRLLLQAISGLAEAHRRGVIHRDLKPANVLVRGGNHAKLADFGLAKRVVSRQPFRPPRLVGTPYFMAPELFSGTPAGPASDVYAAGVTYFYLLTGHLPFVDSSVHELARLHASEPVPDVGALQPGIPTEITAVLSRTLEKRPGDRFRDAGKLAAALRAVVGHLRGMDQLLAEAFAGEKVTWQRRGDRFEVRVPLPDGRAQRVYVEATTHGPVVDRLVKIYSVCAPLRDRESYYRRALELNAEIPHGAIAIEEVERTKYFVMANTYPRTTCDPEEVRHSVLAIAHWADRVEHALTGTDQN